MPEETIRAQQSQTLLTGLSQMGLSLNETQISQLLAYLALLRRWNKAYNLTAVRDPLEHVSRHILDSLATLPHITGNEMLDVGSGAGLPGIPLAIARPETRWTLLDSNGKRTRFLTQCCLELKLPKVEVVQSRVENWQSSKAYDGIVTRAFSSIGSMLALCDSIAGEETRFYALKAELSDDERDEIPDTHQVCADLSLSVPGSGATRYLLILKKNGSEKRD